jgi:hypothetical protein
VAGRHAEQFHDQEVQGITPQALEFDEQWSYVGKKGGALWSRGRGTREHLGPRGHGPQLQTGSLPGGRGSDPGADHDSS